MKEPTLYESLSYLKQYEPHYSVLVKYIETCRESWIAKLCHSSIEGNDSLQRDTLIGKIGTYDDILSIFKLTKQTQ